jgi:hypothetical protein
MVQYNHTAWQRLFGQPSDSVLVNPGVGPPFHLVSRPGGAVTVAERQVFSAAMSLARPALDHARTILDARLAGTLPGAGLVPAQFDHFVDYCFRPAAGALAWTATLNTARANVIRIRNGLWAVGVQIVDLNPNRGGAASGYVRASTSEAVKQRDPAREMSFSGRIHVNFHRYAALNDPINHRNAATTIVHEATHKFCGARDWQNLGGGSKPYLDMIALGLPPVITALANDRALNNADSYAEFVMKMP